MANEIGHEDQILFVIPVWCLYQESIIIILDELLFIQ